MKRKRKNKFAVLIVVLALFAGLLVSVSAAHSICEWDDWTVASEATCTENGIKYRICRADKGNPHRQEQVTPKIQHPFSLIEKASTCTSKGIKTLKCLDCGFTYTEMNETLVKHEYKEAENSPSCGEAGKITYTCMVCGDTIVKELSAGEHEYTEEVTLATCTSVGIKIFTCTLCGDNYAQEFGEMLPHDYTSSEKIDNERALRTVTYTCTLCGNSYVETFAIVQNKEPLMNATNSVLSAVNLLAFSALSGAVFSDYKVLLWRKNRFNFINRIK